MNLNNSYEKLTKDEVKSFCDQLEINLPSKYIDFILTSNGGQADNNRYLKTNLKGKIIYDFYINVFYGISENDTSYDLLTMFSIYCDLIPEGLLPIGDDGVGDLICLGIDKQYYGEVFIWWKNKQVDEGEKPTFDNVEKINDSFVEFINTLT